MTIFLAIVGLGLLVFVHELGHFTASVALRMRPRKFYIGFPPAVVKHTRNGIEYGIGMIPLGGFVKIPGMHRPAPADVDPVFGRAVEEAPALAGPADRLRRALASGDHDAARAALATFAELAARSSSPSRPARGGEGSRRHRRRPRARRVLAGGHVEARARHLRRPGSEHPVRGHPLHGAVHDVGRQGDDDDRGRPRRHRRSRARASRAGDRIVSINGVPMTGGRIPDIISGSNGRPLTLVIAPRRRPPQGSARAPRSATQGIYRLGFILRGEGLSAAGRARESARVTADVSKDIVASLGNIVTGEGRENISSPVGIVQGSSDAAKESTDSYLWVLGLISLSIALLNLLPFSRSTAGTSSSRSSRACGAGPSRGRCTSASRSSGSASCCSCS